jgi:hypothetical protein
MQHDHAVTGPKCRVPDSRALMVHVALIVRGGQGFGAVPFEICGSSSRSFILTRLTVHEERSARGLRPSL